MSGLNRRDFMKRSAATTLATAFCSRMASAAPVEKLSTHTKRTLGKCGVTMSLVGQGSGSAGWAGQSNQTRLGRQEFISLLEHDYDEGIRYFDLADMYGSHEHMKMALRGTVARDDATILTKTVSREPALVKADIERFRKEMDTDYLDIVLMHCLTDPEWPTTMQPCMDVLSSYKERGIIRAVGVSCHHIDATAKVPDTPWVDVVLARINPAGSHMDGKPEQVVPILKRAHENGKGVIGMKIVGMGELAPTLDDSLRFVTGLGCVDAMTIGFESREHLADVQRRLERLSAA